MYFQININKIDLNHTTAGWTLTLADEKWAAPQWSLLLSSDTGSDCSAPCFLEWLRIVGGWRHRPWADSHTLQSKNRWSSRSAGAHPGNLVLRQPKGDRAQNARHTVLRMSAQLLTVIWLVLEAALKHKKKQQPLTSFTQTHLFDEGYWDHVPRDNTMVHELQEGSQGESQHLTVTEKIKNAVTRDLVARKNCSIWISWIRKQMSPSPNKTIFYAIPSLAILVS